MTNGLGGTLSPSVIEFVEAHVGSLLSWDIVVFFARNADAVLDVEGLADRLGRREEEVESEVAQLVSSGLISEHGGLLRYAPSEAVRAAASAFVVACEDRESRLALIAIVLKRLSEAAAQ